MKIQIALQQCHEIIYNPKVLLEGFQMHSTWHGSMQWTWRFIFKYLKSLNQHKNTNSTATVPQNFMNLYTIWKRFSRAFGCTPCGMSPCSGHEYTFKIPKKFKIQIAPQQGHGIYRPIYHLEELLKGFWMHLVFKSSVPKSELNCSWTEENWNELNLKFLRFNFDRLPTSVTIFFWNLHNWQRLVATGSWLTLAIKYIVRLLYRTNKLDALLK